MQYKQIGCFCAAMILLLFAGCSSDNGGHTEETTSSTPLILTLPTTSKSTTEAAAIEAATDTTRATTQSAKPSTTRRPTTSTTRSIPTQSIAPSSSIQLPGYRERVTFSCGDGATKMTFSLDLPLAWRGRYVAVSSYTEDTSCVIFYEINNYQENKGGKLFSVLRIPSDMGEGNFTTLAQKDGYTIGWNKPSDVTTLQEYSGEWSLLEAETDSIKSTFRLIS